MASAVPLLSALLPGNTRELPLHFPPFQRFLFLFFLQKGLSSFWVTLSFRLDSSQLPTLITTVHTGLCYCKTVEPPSRVPEIALGSRIGSLAACQALGLTGSARLGEAAKGYVCFHLDLWWCKGIYLPLVISLCSEAGCFLETHTTVFVMLGGSYKLAEK